MNKIEKSKIELIPLYRKLDESKNDNLKLVILTNTFLELLVNILVEEKLKNSKKVLGGNEYTYSIKLLLLNELNIIKNDLYNFILILKKMRDRAAHQVNFQITKDELNKLPKLPMNETQNLYHASVLVLGSLWNENKDYFIKYFKL
jgi:hypothetical protein